MFRILHFKRTLATGGHSLKPPAQAVPSFTPVLSFLLRKMARIHKQHGKTWGVPMGKVRLRSLSKYCDTHAPWPPNSFPNETAFHASTQRLQPLFHLGLPSAVETDPEGISQWRLWMLQVKTNHSLLGYSLLPSAPDRLSLTLASPHM